MKDEQRREYIELAPTIQEMKDDIKVILKMLNGNGCLGLVAKVHILWTATIVLSGTVLSILVKWVSGIIKGG